MRIALVVTLLCACSSSSSGGEDCDAIAQEIRDMANARGIAQVGVCSSTSAAIQRDFGSLCARLRACQGK